MQRLVMKRVMLVLMTAICFAQTSSSDAILAASADDKWGSIAYSDTTGWYGYSYDYPTQAEAINSAVEACGAGDCRAVVWFANSCGSFAIGNGVHGYARGDTRWVAEERALAECRRRGGGCRIIAGACNSNSRGALPDLVISELSLDPPAPTQGRPVHVRVGIYNQGDQHAGPFKVQWWAAKGLRGPAKIFDIEGLPPRTGRTLHFTYHGYPLFGQIETTAVVDREGWVSESDERNNNRTMMISVYR
jgi:Domain of unknown function (DUF4189)/CARDB